MRHTILGAGGSIGNALAYELLKTKDDNIRLVSRSNYTIPGTDSFKADITSYEETLNSVKNSDIVYLSAGLQYDTKVWTELWYKIMQNTIDACKKVGAKLIFFDNVYMYGKVNGKMTETTPYNPCSRKGEIRAKLATMLEDEFKKKNINAIIARAADFYGPYATKSSVPYVLAIDKLMNGKSAQWLVDVNKPHSFSYTIDCAKGLKLLSKSDESFNQIWHLPTYNPALDGKTFINLIAKELGVAPNYSVLKKWMIKAVGFFNKTLSEIYEMLYQSEFEYYFDSTKFNNFFNYKPISYAEGIHETIEFIKKNK
ncbi:MAG: NAD-dependent epimerase/dehydratase family protein [Ignavibacteriales bacterium]|nr:NAD-dependent epimerase/dehydratase family protein [Ignavibacteriales bacterium]